MTKTIQRILFILFVFSSQLPIKAQNPKNSSAHFGLNIAYAYRLSNEFNAGVNWIAVPEFNKNRGGIYTFSYQALMYNNHHQQLFGQRLSADVGLWRSKMKKGILPHVGLFIETREGFELHSGVSGGVSILNTVALHYRYTFQEQNTIFPLSKHAITLIVHLNMTNLDLAWYKIGMGVRR